MSYNEWREVELNSVAEFYNGKKRPDTKGHIPVFGGNGVLDYCDSFNADDENIIIGRVGAYCGNVNYYKGLCWISDNAILVKSKEGINSKYIYYCLINKKLNNLQIGSSQPLLTQGILKNIQIKLPPLHEQKAIAKILSDLDEKIEINNRINKVLEEIAQTIFKRWFIDFEFPNENGEPYKSSGGEMVDSELGPIPKGWEVGRFRDYIETIISGDWGKENLTGNYKKSVYCVRGADIPEIKKGIKKNLPIRFINEKNYLNKKLIENDLVVEISGGSPTQATGRILYINVELLKGYDKDLICSNFCKVIRLKDVKLMPYFFFYWEYLYNEGVFFQFENGTTGIKNLDINSFIDNFIILKPQEEVLQKYNLFVRKLLSIIHYNGLENQNISQLRDALLPKLMSGEIRVELKDGQIVLKDEC